MNCLAFLVSRYDHVVYANVHMGNFVKTIACGIGESDS